jgi:hypothetical protein
MVPFENLIHPTAVRVAVMPFEKTRSPFAVFSTVTPVLKLMRRSDVSMAEVPLLHRTKVADSLSIPQVSTPAG